MGVAPSRSTLGMKRTTRTRLRPPLRTFCPPWGLPSGRLCHPTINIDRSRRLGNSADQSQTHGAPLTAQRQRAPSPRDIRALLSAVLVTGPGCTVDEANLIAPPGSQHGEERLANLGVFVGALADQVPTSDF